MWAGQKPLQIRKTNKAVSPVAINSPKKMTSVTDRDRSNAYSLLSLFACAQIARAISNNNNRLITLEDA
ncbi:unnamed protein product [Prunus armeniaca]|uniref:Uncharacterized protein n=1 Tax=Prunus armeniaca TaxID=36596 RepID=A0A6J5WMQ5_PRUAR|nr:unnamed protein product [Prunus armeniaca]